MSNELIIEQFFPIHIGYANNPFHNELEKQLIDHCLNLKNTVKKGGHGWISDSTYNTCGTYNILEDKHIFSKDFKEHKIKLNEYRQKIK